MRPVNLQGIVTRFKGDGRRLGYPTANLKIKTGLSDGVYFGFADLGDWTAQPTIIFIGTPTTMGETDRRVEAHLLDIPDRDYYDQNLRLEIKSFYRANKTFDNVEQLLEAMRGDEAEARRWFAANPR
jgi:FAD synthase